VHPAGALGWLAGHIMAWRNTAMNRLAVEVLGVGPDDRILEIGCGPGRAIAMLAARAPQGFVAGVDPSPVMLRQARRRNRRAVAEGRVALLQGAVSRLPCPDGSFTRALAVNIFHHWPDPEADLREVARVLRPAGRLLLGLRMPHPWRRFMAPPGLTPEEIATAEALAHRAGFHDVRREVRRLERDIAFVLATR
jgi:ubiquinone/menaquinone biosynthesis C-methylase UbiE